MCYVCSYHSKELNRFKTNNNDNKLEKTCIIHINMLLCKCTLNNKFNK